MNKEKIEKSEDEIDEVVTEEKVWITFKDKLGKSKEDEINEVVVAEGL